MNKTVALPAIFLAFPNSGFQLPLFLPALVLALIATIGILLNLSVCYITWKYWNKSTTLKSKTSILIAINAFFEILHQSGHLIFFFITITGINFIPASLAFKLEFHSTVSANIANFLFFSMSFDRVIAVAFPLFYVQINFRFYIFCHLLAIFIFAIFILYFQIISVLAHPNYPVTGNLADLYGLPSYFDIRIFTTVFLIFAMLAHLLVGILAKYKGNMANDKMRKLHRSLTLIVFVNIGGYFIFNIVFLTITMVIPMFPVMIWYLSGYLAVILNLSAAANAPILYLNRQLIKEIF